MTAGRGTRAPLAMALLLTSALLAAKTSNSQQPIEPRPDRYHSFLWMLDAPAVDAELFEQLDLLGVSGTNVAGTAPSELHGKSNRPFYIDHAAGKGTLFLVDAEWTPIREAFLAGDLLKGVARPRCLASPDVLTAARARIDEVLSQARPNRPVAYSLDDEISISRRETPLDFCYAEPTLEKFRRFLVARYGSAAALGSAWGTPMTGLAAIMPPTTHAIRRRELLREPSSWNLVPWADHREFMELELTEAVRSLAAHVRAQDPGTPVGFTGGGAPSPFSGLDWSRMLEHVDFVEPYDIGGTRELVRAFAKPDTLVMRTLFPSAAGAHINRHELWDYFLRGDRGVILWSSHAWFDGGEAKRPSELAKELAPTLKELGGPLAREWMRARPVPAEVLVVESQPSNHFHWMLDSRWEGRSWVHRTTSHEVENSTQAATREAWQKLLEDARIPYSHIDARKLDGAALEGIRVLVLPRTIALSESAAEAITRFAQRGTVIADCQLGLATERLAALGKGRLDELFGVKRANHRVHLRGDKVARGPSPPRAPALSFAEPGLTAGKGRAGLVRADHEAIVERRHGKHGRTIYLNLFVHTYLDDRRGKSGVWLRRLIRRFIDEARLAAPIATFTSAGDTPLRMFTRRNATGTLVALHTNQRTTTRAFEDDFVREPTRVRIEASKGHLIMAMRPAVEGEGSRTLEVEVACDEPIIVSIVDASPDEADDVRRK